jgi:hypothetical protein
MVTLSFFSLVFPIALKGEPTQDVSIQEFSQVLDDALNFGKHILISQNLDKLPVSHFAEGSLAQQLLKPQEKCSTGCTIDVWFFSDCTFLTCEFLLMMSFVLFETKLFCNASHIRLFSVIEEGLDEAEERQRLEKLITDFRIPANVQVLSASDVIMKCFSARAEFVNEHSKDCGLSFIPVAPPTAVDDEFVGALEQFSRCSFPVLLGFAQDKILLVDQ